MAKCPKCQSDVSDPIKQWELKGKAKKVIRIGLFECPNCKTKFRAGIK